MLKNLTVNNALWRSLTDPRVLSVYLRTNLGLWLTLVVVTAAVSFMVWKGVGFAITLGTFFGIWAILAVSLNLVIGYTGLLSVAHVAFFGIGAYTVAILTTTTVREQALNPIPTPEWPFFAAVPLGMILAGIVALLVGGVLSRFRDDLFVLVSFGLAIIAHRIFLSDFEEIPFLDRSVTRGAWGIKRIPKPAIGGWEIDGELEFLLLTLVFLALIMLISWFIVSSSFGRVLTAIREDEQAIEVFGYRASLYKLAIWVISAMMAGLAGGLFASWTTFILNTDFVLLESILMVSIVILGGLATIWGSLLGALVFTLLENGVRFVPFVPPEVEGQTQQVILGILLVLVMLFRPQGLIGRYKL
ncbi:MAG: branched-chain amino acid ABC transporter permease [Dehalococcoidia bacterium]